MRTVIFDLDGTLLKQVSYQPQTEALWYAVGMAHGLAPRALDDIEIERHGKTDMQVARELLAAAAPTMPFHRIECEISYLIRFHTICPRSIQDELRTGARAVLDRLKGMGCQTRLATGNCWGIALLKVQRSGLSAVLDFEWGGYGVHEKREDVLRMSLRDAQDPIYVCDTARDIEAADALGLPTIGVVTDEQTEDDLSEAHYVVESLLAIPPLVERLNGVVIEGTGPPGMVLG